MSPLSHSVPQVNDGSDEANKLQRQNSNKSTGPTSFSGQRRKPEKPKRALTAYNWFFQLERKRLIDSLPMKLERKPKKGHGKIDFTTLAKTISVRWKALSASERVPYSELALQDKVRYYRELEVWEDLNSRLRELDEKEGGDHLRSANLGVRTVSRLEHS